MMNIDKINEKMKQRPPFQMIDRVTELVPNESAVGIKCVSVNEPIFGGHFPGSPVMPGVLMIESCAQLCSLVIDTETNDDKLYVLLKVENFKFVKPVIPGDRMEISVKKTRGGGTVFYFDAEVRVDGNVHASGSIVFTSMNRSSVYAG